MGEKEEKRIDEEEESPEPTEFPDQDVALDNESHVQKIAADDGVGFSKDRATELARIETEKKLALIKAWEDNEKTKAENKAYKKLLSVDSWENTKRAMIEAQLKQSEEEFEKKKAEYREKMKNKLAIIHKQAEEKRALVEAEQGKDVLKAEETAQKFRATGVVPKKLMYLRSKLGSLINRKKD